MKFGKQRASPARGPKKRRYLTDGDELPEKGHGEVGFRIVAENLSSGAVSEYPTQVAAAAACGVSVMSVSNVSRGLRSSVKGWKFKRVG